MTPPLPPLPAALPPAPATPVGPPPDPPVPVVLPVPIVPATPVGDEPAAPVWLASLKRKNSSGPWQPAAIASATQTPTDDATAKNRGENRGKKTLSGRMTTV